MVKKTIGKNTLGDNNKMKVAMRDYERSKHNIVTGKHTSTGDTSPLYENSSNTGDDVQNQSK